MRMSIKGLWTYGFCESCLKNSHEKIEMVEQELFTGDSKGKYLGKIWVCPVCGATKSL